MAAGVGCGSGARVSGLQVVRSLTVQRGGPPARLGIWHLGEPDVVCGRVAGNKKPSCLRQLGRDIRRCGLGSGVGGQSGGQSGGQVGRACEFEQDHSCVKGFAYGQGLQLLTGKRLDLGSGGVA